MNKVKINELPGNFIEFGKFILTEDKKNKLNLKSNCNDNILKSLMPRIYFITINDYIFKIGRSSDKKGIKSTIGFYCQVWSGTPSRNRYFIGRSIYKLLKSGTSNIKVYGIFEGENTLIPNFSNEKLICSSEFLESVYIMLHKHKVAKAPKWNFQENNEKIPIENIDMPLKGGTYAKLKKNKL